MSGITDPIFPMLCQNPKLAGHPFCGPVSSSAKETLEVLEGELENLDYSLQVVESVTEFTKYTQTIEGLREKIGIVRAQIAKPLEYAEVYQDAKELVAAIRGIQGVDPRSSPEARAKAARAWGAAMTSFGKLVQKLGPPASAAGAIIAEMGRNFHEIVENMQPGIHIKGDNKRILDEDPVP